MTTDRELPAPPWRRERGKPRRQLNVDVIVDAAMRVMGAEGLEAVSMRRVAHELDTGPASLYAHVRDKRELHELMLDAAMRDIPVPEPDPERWQQQLKQLGLDQARIMVRNPGIARIAMETLIPTTPGILVTMDAMLGIVRSSGLPARLVPAACDGLALYVTAFAYEASLWSSAQDSEARKRLEEINAYLDSLPADRVPHLVAMREHFRNEEIDHFEFMLDVFIAGVAAQVNASKR